MEGIESPYPEKESTPDTMDPCEEKEFVPRYQQKKINVFVSSTFRDMKAERDELTLRVFPALRKVCEERGIAWGEVDLRWGIPEEKKGEVLSICMKFIDECRPYFIGILGERYGWVEETAPESVIKDFPWITNHSGESITELEILHGVLNNPVMAGHAYFYFRDPGYVITLPPESRSEFFEGPVPEDVTKYGADKAELLAEKRRRKLVLLKETIRKTQVPVRENYRDSVQFGELVQEDLMGVIDSLAPLALPMSDVERVRGLSTVRIWRTKLSPRAVSVSTSRARSTLTIWTPMSPATVGRSLSSAIPAAESQPSSPIGRTGTGHTTRMILSCCISSGLLPRGTDWAAMLRRFMGEFKWKFSINAEIPANNNVLPIVFATWLSIAAEQCRVVLVIDALNQLEDRNGAPDLVWLPPTIPGNIHLIVSTLPGRSLDALRNRGWPSIDVEPLTVPERNALIICYLRKIPERTLHSFKGSSGCCRSDEKSSFPSRFARGSQGAWGI